MKALFFCLLLTGSAALAQSTGHANLTTSIDDDDKLYSIRIDGDRSGKEIHYNRTFNVAGMSRNDKESLKNRVLDSLGLGDTPPPHHAAIATVADGPAKMKVTFACPSCTGKTRISITGNGFSAERNVVIDSNKSGFPFELDMPPGDYRYTYWQNNVEQMRLPFTVKAGLVNTVIVK